MTGRARRIHQRRAVELCATIVAQSGRCDAVTRDLGLGGASLRCDQPLQFGDAVQITLQLPALDEPSCLDAVVRWRADGHLGVQFGGLRARDVWALNLLLAG